MKKFFLIFYIVIFSSCSTMENLSQEIAKHGEELKLLRDIDYKYVYESEQKRREQTIENLMHQDFTKGLSRDDIEKQYVKKYFHGSMENTNNHIELFDGVEPALSGETCSVMEYFYFQGFDNFSDYAMEHGTACFTPPKKRNQIGYCPNGIQINRGGNNLALRYLKLIKLCETCESEYPDIAHLWREYLIKQLDKEYGDWNKKDLIRLYGESNADEIAAYVKHHIPENKEIQAQERLREKARISKKYGYEWCSDKINDNCLIKNEKYTGFKVVEQRSDGTLVKTTTAGLFTLVTAFTTGLPMLFEDYQCFIIANPKDAKIDEFSNIDDGIFALVGTYQYLSLDGTTRTVKKLKRLE